MQTHVSTSHALSLYAQARAANTLSAYMDAAGALASVVGAKRAPKAHAPVALAPGQVDAVTLSQALARACRVAEAHSHIPILQNVRLTAGEHCLEIISTDLDIQQTEMIGAEGLGVWDLTVNARALADLLRKSKGAVSLAPEVDALSVKIGETISRLPTRPAIDFPIMEKSDAVAVVSFETAEFVEAAKAVQFAISTEETRYYLNGVHLNVARGAVTLTATDGHRLMRVTLIRAWPSGEMPEGGVIIPRKTLEIILRGLPRQDRFEVAISRNKVDAIPGAGLRIRSKLIDGSFPDCDRVIPQASAANTWIEGDARALGAAFASVAAAATEKYPSVRLDVRGYAAPDGPGATAAHKGIDGAYASAPLPVVATGASACLGFNAAYLADACAFDGPVRFHIEDPASPVRVEYPHAPNRLGVLMPLRL